MNLPNKLTVFRLATVPVILATALIDFPFHWCVTLVVYALGCISDFLDGNIARKRNLVTDFGKLMDPLADKALVMTAFTMFVSLGYCDVVCFSLMLAREFLVSGVRMIASTKGKVIPANIYGKIKTVLQMVATNVVFFSFAVSDFIKIDASILHIIAFVLFWACCIASLLSGIKYTKDGWYLIESK